MAQSKHHKHPKTKLMAKTPLYFVYCKNMDSNIIQSLNLLSSDWDWAWAWDWGLEMGMGIGNWELGIGNLELGMGKWK